MVFLEAFLEFAAIVLSEIVDYVTGSDARTR
jgi:hypothetical protein